jgi:1,2-diacylglycerol 3-alpha-glucosyltransferase
MRGGVETLIVRLAKRLKESGHVVQLLLSFGSGEKELLDEFKQYGEIVQTGAKWRVPLLLQQTRLRTVPDRILSFGLNSLLHSLLISQRLDFRIPVAAAIYFPRELCWKCDVRSFRQLLAHRAIAAMPARNLAFVSSAAKDEHEQCLGLDMDDSWTLSIPVDTARYKDIRRMPEPNEIASIGRLVDFKNYNSYMIDVIDEFKARGRELRYHIYGDGPTRSQLEKKVKAKQLERLVIFHGEIPYRSFPDVLARSRLFIGMGTSVIEAAACGVPSLVAIESAPGPYTYGLLHEQQTSTIGDLEHGRAVFPLVGALRRVLDADEVAYKAHCEASRAAARLFAMESSIARYIAFVEGTQPFLFSIKAMDALVDFCDLVGWQLRRTFGMRTPFDSRYVAPRVSIEDGRICVL